MHEIKNCPRILTILPFLFLLVFAGPLFAVAPDSSGKRYAVCIGINEYADSSIVKLSTPRNDAADLGARLVSAGWDKVFVLKDDVDYRNQDFPSRTNIENRINLLADLVKSEDTIFIFFSGHGVSGENESSILPVDASLSRLKETCIPISSIVSTFNARGLKRVILAIDACREQVSVTKGLSVVGISGGSLSNAASLTLFATKAGWYSYEDPDGRNGVFTRFLLSGLSRDADGSGSTGARDGIVTFSELASWLPDATGSYALDRGVRQQAVAIRGSGDAGALDVVVSPVSSTGSAVSADGATPVAASGGDASVFGAIGKHISSIIEKSLSNVDTSIEVDAAKKDQRAQARAAQQEKDAQDLAAKRDQEAKDLAAKKEAQSLAAANESSSPDSAAGNESAVADSGNEKKEHGFSLIQLGLFDPAQLIPASSSVFVVAVGVIQTKNYHNFGVQVALISATELMGGAQVGVLSFADTVGGIQVGGILSHAKTVYGGQFGLINTADDVYGIQCGFINVAKNLHGVQVGGINILEHPGLLGHCMLGVNIGI